MFPNNLKKNDEKNKNIQDIRECVSMRPVFNTE